MAAKVTLRLTVVLFQHMRLKSHLIWIQEITSINSCLGLNVLIVCHLPSSDSLLSLVSCSICWHHPSMRAVSACSSFRNQLPSRRQAGVLGWTASPWVLQFPVSRLGSGGGSEEGSKAGSRVSGGEVDILDGAEVCLRGFWSMALSCLLGAVVFTVWLLVQLAVLFSVGVVSWGSVSVFCLEAMLLSRLRLQKHA